MTSEHHQDGKPAKPRLRLTGSMNDAETPAGTDAPFLATRLGVLTHELAGLLDGSLRCLGIARRSLQAGPGSSADPNVEQQLRTVHAALERMAGLVLNAMQGSGSTIGASVTPNERCVSLADAIEHAIAVVAPLANEHRIELTSTITPVAGAHEAGPVYVVVLNGLRNAIEAIASAGTGGSIDVGLAHRAGSPESFELTIADDGPGLSPACEDGRAFVIGLTTKPGGNGIGLCLAGQVIGQLGGRIALTTRSPSAKDGRRGAMLSASWPVPRGEPQGPIG